MRALIVIAHGSRREASNVEFRNVVAQMSHGLSGLYERVVPAFLDGVSPALEEAAADLMGLGAINVDVYPFFLNTGKHADQDIPALVAAWNTANQSCQLSVLDYLGKSDEIVHVCVRHVVKQSV